MTRSRTTTIPADPDAVFEAVTAIDRLPDWNHAITSVVDRPADLTDGAEWVVELHALGRSWHSRATLTTIDRRERRFGYRSRTDDGNPSWADWRWSIDEHPDGAEVPSSLAALSQYVAATNLSR